MEKGTTHPKGIYNIFEAITGTEVFVPQENECYQTIEEPKSINYLIFNTEERNQIHNRLYDQGEVRFLN